MKISQYGNNNVLNFDGCFCCIFGTYFLSLVGLTRLQVDCSFIMLGGARLSPSLPQMLCATLPISQFYLPSLYRSNVIIHYCYHPLSNTALVLVIGKIKIVLNSTGLLNRILFSKMVECCGLPFVLCSRHNHIELVEGISV